MRVQTSVLLVLMLVIGPVFAQAEPIAFDAVVVRVTDGDTIVVEDASGRGANVRIVSIDAPEKGRRGIPGQPYSELSRQHLLELVGGKPVRVVVQGVDDYGRVLARVWLAETDIGLAQVCAGYAWVFEAFIDEIPVADQGRYRSCQVDAQADRRGLWRHAQPTPPWVWRYSRRDERRR